MPVTLDKWLRSMANHPFDNRNRTICSHCQEQNVRIAENKNFLFTNYVDSTSEDIRSFLKWAKADIGSTKELAEKMEVKPNYINMLLRDRPMGRKTAERLARIYNLSYAEMIEKGKSLRLQNESSPTKPARRISNSTDTQTQQMLYAAATEHLPSTIHWPVIILNSTQIHYSLEKARVVLESRMHLSSNALALNIDRFYEQVTQGEEKRGLPPPAKSPSESPPSTGIIPAEEPPETEELRHKFKALIGGRSGVDVGA